MEGEKAPMNGNGKCLAVAGEIIEPEGHSIVPEPSEEFVLTPHIQALTSRALSYLQVGYGVHFAGPAGMGKTTLALHVAAQLGRPVVLIHGDDEFGSSDLIGKDSGYRKCRLVDNYIHSVVKTEESMSALWEDHQLTTACLNGYTLIYDEFNRSRPEANNVLLGILEGRVLNLPNLRRSGDGYVRVHEDFRAILTSNPEEYAGVHKTQDALIDRLITIHLGHFDRETEIRIAQAKSGLPRSDAERIVDIVRELRGVGVNNHRPTIRACIAIGKVLAHRRSRTEIDDPTFWSVCSDILNTDTAKVTHEGQSLMLGKVEEAIAKVCGNHSKGRKNRHRVAMA
jgi:nitric oxide reductase NorQ protein